MKIQVGQSYSVMRCKNLAVCTCETELEGTNEPPCGVEVYVLSIVARTDLGTEMAHVTFGHPEDRLSAWVDVKILRNLA